MRLKTLVSRLRAEEPQPAVPPALDRDLSRTLARGRRALVRFTKRSTHLSDDDNLAESYKWLRDWLCAAGLVAGDGPGQIQAEYRQEKVARRKESGTIVEIIYCSDSDDGNTNDL